MQKYKDELKIKKREKIIFQFALFGFVSVVGLIGLTYLLFFSRLLDVRDVKIEVADGLRADLSKYVDGWLDLGFWNINKRDNILFFSADKLSSHLASQFPKLESVKISKKLPHSLFISSDERKPAGIWCSAVENECYYFDKNGVAFSKTQPSSGFLIINVFDYRQDKNIELGNMVTDEAWLKEIIDAHELLNRAGINIAAFEIPADSFDEFHVKTAENWKIMFSIQTNVEKQISALITFLKEKIRPDQRSSLQYVDLRIQDRIYYK
ncbi:MAG: hypothetical protein HYT61_01770 [Candidatus Yanofskybacteria bacterium]|nr:hypothetical protein [Candidatus Yanofskybacteria bacterium]